jgi:YidC/Oxa1 family membrane protein insertase
MVILITWSWWGKLFSPEQTAPPQEIQDTTAYSDTLPVTEEAKTPQLPAITEPEPETREAVITAEPAAPERTVNIETDDMIVTMSSYGGVIKSIKLKHYFVENGADGDSLVELLAPAERNPWNVPGAITLGDEETVLPVNEAAFDVSGRSAVIGEGDQPKIVSFTYTDSASGGMIRKDYTFFPEKYQIKLRIAVDNAQAFGFDDRITVGWLVPNWPSEKDLKNDLGQFAGFYSMGGESVENKNVKEVNSQPIRTGASQWVANRSKYFTNAIITQDEMGSEILIEGNQSQLIDYENKNHEWKQFGVGITFDIEGNSFANDFLLYTGPLDYYRLEKIGYGLGRLVDMGWKVFRPFAIGILWVFVMLHKILFNYGVVIIVFSLVMKVVFWPLTRKSSTSMMKMKELQPKMQEIKEKFSKDPQKLNAETMKLYKEYGVNPFGSCLPLLIQLPIFWALFSVLRNSIELRAADFVFWIKDLSQKDPTWVLPILMGLAMFFQQKMTITDPKQKMMAYIMPVVFVFIFGGMPSGLVLYWTIFSVVGVFEQLLIKRSLEEEKRAQAS